MAEETITAQTPEIDPGMSVMPEGPGLMDVPTVIPELGLAAQALASQVSFAKKTWKDGSGGGTPVTAAELNRLEQGVADLTAAVNGLRESVSQCFAPRGRVPYGGDANDVREIGAHIISYETNNPVKNMPSGCYRYGSILVFSNDVNIVQMYVTSETSPNVYVRIHIISTGEWENWSKVSIA